MKKTERASKPSTRIEVDPEGEPGEMLDMDEIKELIGLVAEKDFAEFELVRGRFKLRLRRGSAGPEPVLVVSQQTPGASPTAEGTTTQTAQAYRQTSPLSTGAESETEAKDEGVATAPEENLHIITSPIVGTFFHAASPTAEPFVNVGDSIVPGKTLCIIEAMKLMNEIQSEVTGVIERVFVENGQPIEYGQPLFGVKL
jgi:acetyl-CoA carboxylase biotin carboxyl carrier protein